MTLGPTTPSGNSEPRTLQTSSKTQSENGLKNSNESVEEIITRLLAPILSKIAELSEKVEQIRNPESHQMKLFRQKIIFDGQGVSKLLKDTIANIEKTKQRFEKLRMRARFIRKAVEHISALYKSAQEDLSIFKHIKEIPYKKLKVICRSSMEALKGLESYEEPWTSNVPQNLIGQIRSFDKLRYQALCKEWKKNKNKPRPQSEEGWVDRNPIFRQLRPEQAKFLFERESKAEEIHLEEKLDESVINAIKQKGKALYEYVKKHFNLAEQATRDQKDPNFDLKTFLEVLKLFKPNEGITSLSTLASDVKKELLAPLEDEARGLLKEWEEQKLKADELIQGLVKSRIKQGEKLEFTPEQFKRVDNILLENFLVTEGENNGVCVKALSDPKNSFKNQFELYDNRTEACIEYEESLQTLMASIQDPKENGARYEAGKMLYELKSYLDRGCQTQGIFVWVWNASTKGKAILSYLKDLTDVTDTASLGMVANKKDDDEELSDESRSTSDAQVHSSDDDEIPDPLTEDDKETLNDNK